MKLLICMITYNRLEYTKRTLRSLWNTIEVPYYLVVVDNASTDGTVEYLKTHEKYRNRIDKVIFNPENYYPGKACNIGWYQGLKEYPNATHLMRLDNDMKLVKGWDTKVEEYFEKIPTLGQLGLDHGAIEGYEAQAEDHNGMMLNPWPGCVGGPNVIRREIWEKGIRYDETPWQTRDLYTPDMQEDSKLSHTIKGNLYLVGHMSEKLAWTFADETNWKEYPDYYKKTFTERGYGNLLDKI